MFSCSLFYQSQVKKIFFDIVIGLSYKVIFVYSTNSKQSCTIEMGFGRGSMKIASHGNNICNKSLSVYTICYASAAFLDVLIIDLHIGRVSYYNGNISFAELRQTLNQKIVETISIIRHYNQYSIKYKQYVMYFYSSILKFP